MIEEAEVKRRIGGHEIRDEGRGMAVQEDSRKECYVIEGGAAGRGDGMGGKG